MKAETEIGTLSNLGTAELEEHEIEKLYSFKDFIKYKFDGMILSIIAGIIVSACFNYVIINL